MNQNEVFQSALWVGPDKPHKHYFGILRGKFYVKEVRTATLRVLGLGYFHCYINGKRVSDEYFLPLNTDYEVREQYPDAEILSGHRIYVPEYDVSDMLSDGENVIAIHFGGGWYAGAGSWWDPSEFGGPFGLPKAIWRVFGEDSEGAFDFGSSEADKICDSYVTDYYVTTHEVQDLRLMTKNALAHDFDDTQWANAVPASAVETEYLFSDCPADKVCERLTPIQIGKFDDRVVYDCGKNITGYPVLLTKAGLGEQVTVLFSEERTAYNDIDMNYQHNQRFIVTCDGEEHELRPFFLWFGFRYFSVQGDAEVVCVENIHADVAVTAHFESDKETLNWINEAFVNTQLSNMHGGIPSDCPHLERRGYTGDGQLVCHAAMTVLDAKAFYRKWIGDILDCQDQKSGHIQYTAPYLLAGGGPGGWGCAIVEVPYQYYLHYGDVSMIAECYPAMLRYFDFLEAHSEGNLVTSTQKGLWCLGDWCSPEDVALPAPFVNNYFYIKSLITCVRIAKLIGKEADIPMLQERIAARKKAMQDAYFNTWDGNFFGGIQGANAFAVDVGIGDDRTYKKLVSYYQKLGCFDTGIFGTDIVTRVLFEHGDGQLATDLLLSTRVHSFAEIKRRGGTTFWEYWPDSTEERSHNHPMFGAVTAYLYDYLLGIRQEEGVAGYSSLIISPVIINCINHLSGYRTVPGGTVSVSYRKSNDYHIEFCIGIPAKQKAEFVTPTNRIPLHEGENVLRFPLSALLDPAKK